MSIIIFVIILLVLIVGHEFGHLLVAKWARMDVPEFGVGFPPKLWGRKIGSTEYTINALPFGGFVRIIGENAEDETNPRAFMHKPKYAQAAVMAAGPFANMVLAFVAFFIAYSVGVTAVQDETHPVQNPFVMVSDVLKDSPAEHAGVLTGDTLVSLERDDTIVQISNAADIPTFVQAAEGEITLHLSRSGESVAVTLTPAVGLIPENPTAPAIGIGSATVGTLQLGFFDALYASLIKTTYGISDITVGLGTLLWGAVTGSASLKDISGPVGIATLVGEAATFGAGQVFLLAAILSLNLAVINLFPFPALDGGRLLMLAYETIVRRRVPPYAANVINTVGFFALIALMLAVTASDIVKLVQ
ncbi:MAG: M50 family metallopeptidase [Patescibacteria group bacterium]